MAQIAAIARAGGAPPPAIEANQALERQFPDAVATAKDQTGAEAAIRTVLKGAMPDSTVDAQVKAGASPRCGLESGIRIGSKFRLGRQQPEADAAPTAAVRTLATTPAG